MSDELPAVTPEFLSSELSRTVLKLMKKKGGPYTKSNRVKRRNEVFRLHFSLGYSAVKISQLMNVNRHTIESDIKFGYSILQKDFERGDIMSMIMKQVYRLEEQRTRIIERSILKNDQIDVTAERLLADIEFKLARIGHDIYRSEDRNYEIVFQLLNNVCEKDSLPFRYLNDKFQKVSPNVLKEIKKLKEKDFEENINSWIL